MYRALGISKFGWAALAFFLATGLSALAMEGPDTPVTFEQCRDQLLSGDFVITQDKQDGKEIKPMPQFARHLARTVQDLIDKKGSKDFPKAVERFDRIHDGLMQKIVDGKLGIDETSENILDDCFYSVHPDAAD
jgi:hypothetical protein